MGRGGGFLCIDLLCQAVTSPSLHSPQSPEFYTWIRQTYMYHQLGQAVFFLLWGGVPYLIWWAGEGACGAAEEGGREGGREIWVHRSCKPDRVGWMEGSCMLLSLCTLPHTSRWEFTVYGMNEVWIRSLAHCPARLAFLFVLLCPPVSLRPLQRGFVIRILLTMHVSSVLP